MRLLGYLMRPLAWLKRIFLCALDRVLAWDGQAWQAVFTLLGVVAGGVITVYAGVTTYKQWRNDKVLELQSRWETPEMQERRARLLDAFVCRGVPYIMQGLETEDDLVRQRLYIVLPGKGYEGIDRDASAYLDFFDDVRTCVDTGVCNEQTACTRFRPEANWLGKVLGPYLARQRILFRQRDYGQSFEQLKISCAPYWPKESGEERVDFDEAEVVQFGNLMDELQPERLGSLHYQREAACRRMEPEDPEAPGKKKR